MTQGEVIMAPRQPYALIFSNDPPAADIARKDLIVLGPFEKGAECRFKWADPKLQPKKDKDKSKPKPPPVYVEVEGRIIETGTKVNLSKLQVSDHGEIVESGGVGTKAQEIKRLTTLQNNAEVNHLQDVAEEMLSNGPAATYQRVPVVSRLPKKRSAAAKKKIKSDLYRLPCLKPHSNRVHRRKLTGTEIELT
ncbi:uncharacterized protein LOC127750939 [Frankliniella occidentalis]|uniref:Uncharacterized protein LOC127750939 n=1 Tax=Frankliniella occidentalis TaxID=133901 RepID=A0A9C6X5M4_FRAOC|nr:uncharacterized protein LOC127750939 [Frankliniella occidentalis]